MNVKNHAARRKNRAAEKRLQAVTFGVLLLVVVLAVFQYFQFVTRTVYDESVSHLREITHQSDNMLRELANKNLTYLHMWSAYLQTASDEQEIRNYIQEAQADAGFLHFYFLSPNGNYKMVSGETGYLGLRDSLEDSIQQGTDMIMNATLPGSPQMLLFASPKAQGSYQGFEYDAIAIAYENRDIVDALDIATFNGNAKSYVVHPDGRIVIDHSFESWENTYNFFGILRTHSNLSEDEILALSARFKAGQTGALMANLDGKNYYLVYEKSDIQDWIFLGLVQADIVNAGMNTLQFSTILLVGGVMLGIAAFAANLIIQRGKLNLRKKDTEILYRDELFQKLSLNVDDVFLMLDAKTYQADYISPNAERLLGITEAEIRRDVRVLGKLHPEDSEKNYLEGIQVHEQLDWDF